MTPTFPRLPLLFMHIPKTSGSALVSSFVATGQGHTVEGFDRTIFGSFADWASLTPEIRATIAMSAADLPRDALMVSGHYALSTLREAFPNAPVLTILRDPTTRLLSHWLYWRALDPGTFAAWGSWSTVLERARAPLASFLSDPSLACQLDNIVVRLLLSPHPLVPPGDFIAPRHDLRLLREARNKLRHLDFVDLVENPAIERNLATWLNWATPRSKVNVTAAMPREQRSPLDKEFSVTTVELLRARSRLDQVLWNDVARRRLGKGEQITVATERARLVGASRYGALMSAAVFE